MKSKKLAMIVLVFLLCGPFSIWSQEGNGLGNSLIVSYVTGYNLVLTTGDAYFKGYPKEDALERCKFAIALVNGSRVYFSQMVGEYAQAGLIDAKDRSNAEDLLTLYKLLIEAARSLQKFIESDKSDAEAYNNYTKMMVQIYMGFEGAE